MTMCRLNGRFIDIELAINLRRRLLKLKKNEPNFQCIECGESVKPYEYEDCQSRFQHIVANPNCRYSSGYKR